MEEHSMKVFKPGAVLFVLNSLILLVLSSCSGTNTTLLVLRGNLLFRSGEDALATYRYLQALETGGVQRWEDWIDYDLGSLYISQGEINPGVRVLNRSLEGFADLSEDLNRRDRELFYRIFFNQGVAHYEIGNYREAGASFIQALRLKSDSWDAKINLELSIAGIVKANSNIPVSSGSEVPDSSEDNRDSQSEEILESIHREEKPAWVSAPAQDIYEQDW
jgi:tetratricopeptide (TPR) repeat protein